jgi:transposase
MEKTTTPVRFWYFAIFLFSQSKNGVSAMELTRQLRVTYKTAFRMGHKIRESMSSAPVELRGIVHIDESLFGPRGKNNKRGWAAEKKTCLFGIIEKDGRVKVVVVKDRKHETLLPIIEKYVSKDAEALPTDKFRVYKSLPAAGYTHKIKGNTTVSTNCI